MGELDKLGPPLGLPALLNIALSNNAVARKQLYRPSLLRRRTLPLPLSLPLPLTLTLTLTLA